MTAPDLEAVHAAILAEPDDDLCRLAYADLLEERGGPGDDARAEFIRVQVELAAMPKFDSGTFLEMADRFGFNSAKMLHECNNHDLLDRQRRLTARVERIRADVSGRWHGLDSLSPGVYATAQMPSSMGVAVRYWRGFVEEVRLTTDHWHAHGPRLVREHPIRVVRLTDRAPLLHSGGCYSWKSGANFRHPDPWRLPEYLWAKLPGRHLGSADFWRDVMAYSALSDACLAWAKSIKPRARHSPSASRRSATVRRTASASSPGTSRPGRSTE